MSRLRSGRRFGRVALLTLGIGALGAGPASAADWGKPFTVSTASTRPAGFFEVGSSTRGVNTFLWPGSSGDDVTVESRRVGPTGGLSPLQPVSGAFSSAPNVDLAINPPSGKGAAGWEIGSFGSANHAYQVRMLRRDGALGPLQTVVSSRDAGGFGLGTKGDGTALALWGKLGSRLSDPLLTQFRPVSPGGDLGPTRTLQSIPRGQVSVSSGQRAVVAPSGGNVFFFWQWGDNQGKPHLSFRRMAPDATLGPVTQVLGPGSYADGDGTVTWDAVALPDGGVAVAFTRAAHNGSTYTGHFIEARRITASGQLGPVKRLASAAPWQSEPYFAVLDDPHIAVDPAGNATAVWVQALSNTNAAVKSRRLAASGALGETRTMTGDTYAARTPDVAVDANGVATAVFAQGDVGNGAQRIQARRVVPNGTVGPLKNLGQGNRPQAIVGPGDVTTAAWAAQNLFDTSLKAARHDSSPGAVADDRVTAATDRVEPKSGPYRGKTTQDRPVTFEVGERRVKDFTSSVKMPRSCRKAGYPGNIGVPKPMNVSRKGKFSFRGGESPFGTQILVIKGEFVSRRKVSGTLRVDFDLKPPSGRECRFEKTVPYAAHRR